MTKQPSKITELWAYIAVHDDGDEGVMGCTMMIAGQLTMVPMVAADRARLDSLAPHAEMISRETNTPYTLKHFKLE